MAELNLSVRHGQPGAVARANFEKAIAAAQAEHARWIRRVEWSPDRGSATVSGPAYSIVLSFDEENVYARGHVPMAIKLLEGPVRKFVERTLGGR